MNRRLQNRSASHLTAILRAKILGKLSTATVLAVVAIGNQSASAQELTPAGVQWQCVQQNDASFNVLCLPRQIGDASVTSAKSSGLVPGSLPVHSDLRPVAERGLEEVFSAKAWTVPLYSEPTDQGKVSHLLQSVLCDAAPYCSVKYRSN